MDNEILEDINKVSTEINKTDDNRAVDNVAIEKGNESWYKTDLHTKTAPIADPGQGIPVIIRNFEFAKDPTFKGNITSQDIFNMHWRQISNILWSDGLVPLEEVEPRIVFNKNGNYRIFITCKASLRTIVADKPHTLNQLLNKKKKR